MFPDAASCQGMSSLLVSRSCLSKFGVTSLFVVTLDWKINMFPLCRVVSECVKFCWFHFLASVADKVCALAWSGNSIGSQVCTDSTVASGCAKFAVFIDHLECSSHIGLKRLGYSVPNMYTSIHCSKIPSDTASRQPFLHESIGTEGWRRDSKME